MSHRKRDDQLRRALGSKQNFRQMLKIEGKTTHGTRGKPTRGPRGNKKF